MFHDYDAKLPSEEKILEIKNLIPSGKWPIGLHHEIALKANTSPSIIYNVMSYLLDNNLIDDGRKQ